MTGKIVKAISGFYYIEFEDKIYECRAKGILKKNNISPMVGDNAEFEEPLGSAPTSDADSDILEDNAFPFTVLVMGTLLSKAFFTALFCTGFVDVSDSPVSTFT